MCSLLLSRYKYYALSQFVFSQGPICLDILINNKKRKFRIITNLLLLSYNLYPNLANPMASAMAAAASISNQLAPSSSYTADGGGPGAPSSFTPLAPPQPAPSTSAAVAAAAAAAASISQQLAASSGVAFGGAKKRRSRWGEPPEEAPPAKQAPPNLLRPVNPVGMIGTTELSEDQQKQLKEQQEVNIRFNIKHYLTIHSNAKYLWPKCILFANKTFHAILYASDLNSKQNTFVLVPS